MAHHAHHPAPLMRSVGHWVRVHVRRHIPFAAYTVITLAMMAWFIARMSAMH